MRLDPIWVARRMRWASPPESVPAFLERVRYPRPTCSRNLRRDLISFKTWLAISCSFSESLRPSKNSRHSLTERFVTSTIDLSEIFTARTFSLSLFPLHLGQGRIF